MSTINSNGAMAFGNALGGSVTIVPKNDTATDYTIDIDDVSGTLATQEWATSQDLGVGQAWQSAELTSTGALFTDGTPKHRAVNTAYTNSTGKPIEVAVTLTTNSTTGYFRVKINGTTMFTSTQASSGLWISCIFIVPGGATYLIEPVNATLSGSYWSELR